MHILIINQREIARLLPMRECIEIMASALETLSRGGAILPLRTVLRLPGGQNAFAAMPAYMQTPEAMAVKVVSVFPGNHGTALDSHQGAVILFEAEHGSPVALMDASSITAIRTAAVSAVATRALARTNATELAILGSGVQARTHLEAIPLVRPVRHLRVWSRNEANARGFADHARRTTGLTVEVHDSASAAVDGADIVCTTTSSREPVLRGDWLTPGVHVNAIGTSLPIARELDTAAVVRSRLFADRRESVMNEAGEFVIARNEGAIGDDHIVAEVGEVLTGQHQGRESEDEITLFKSLGLAVEDVASARHVYERAVREGVGVSVDFGGGRDATD